jgi:hypothetical protein
MINDTTRGYVFNITTSTSAGGSAGLQLPVSANLSTTLSQTRCAWIYPTLNSTSTNYGIIGGQKIVFTSAYQTTSPNVRIWSWVPFAGSVTTNGTFVMNTSTWYFVSLVYNIQGSSAWGNLYVSDQTNIVNLNNSTYASISGTFNTDPFLFLSDQVTSSWQGRMDEMRIYNRALSISELQTIYNQTKK